MPAPPPCARGSPRDAAAPAPCPTASGRRPCRSSAPAPRPKCSAPLVLRAEARSARHLLHLLLAVPEHGRPRRRSRCGSCTRRARCRAARAFEIEPDPGAARRDLVAVEQQRPALVGDDDVERAAIPQVGDGDRSAVVAIRRADHLRDVEKASGAVAHPHLLLLIAGQAARRPSPASCARRQITIWLPPAIFEKSYQ